MCLTAKDMKVYKKHSSTRIIPNTSPPTSKATTLNPITSEKNFRTTGYQRAREKARNSSANTIKHGECKKICDSTGHECVVDCKSTSKHEKRQCLQMCDEDGLNCTTVCIDEPRQTCYTVCSPSGECTTECSLVGNVNMNARTTGDKTK
jgi:hypothetical protein